MRIARIAQRGIQEAVGLRGAGLLASWTAAGAGWADIWLEFPDVDELSIGKSLLLIELWLPWGIGW